MRNATALLAIVLAILPTLGAACGSGDGAATGAGARRSPCLSAPSDVVIIGDSYVTGALSPALQPALGALYPAANQFRNYAVAGTAMATGGLTGKIPPQFDQAVAADPSIQLVIMDGGGNDILICDGNMFPGCGSLCSMAGSSTQKACTDIVAAAIAGSEQLMARAADAGVKDVVYFFYPHIPAMSGGYKEILDYSVAGARMQCEATAARTGGRMACHFVDLVQPFAAAGGDMNPANFSILDGIHPSQAGQEIIAQQIWTTMTTSCLGQPASSGCCMP